MIYKNSLTQHVYSHAPHNDVLVNNGDPILLYYTLYYILLYTIMHYGTYHCVTTAYSIQYSNKLYRFWPRTNKLYHITKVCGRLRYLGLC